MSSKKYCIVHYDIRNQEYSELSNVSQNAYERILEAKTIREELGGDNYHEEQCLKVPDILDNSIHAMHLNPCYKKITLIISTYNNKKRKNENEAESSRAKRNKSDNSKSVSRYMLLQQEKKKESKRKNYLLP